MHVVTIDVQEGKKFFSAELAIPESWDEVPLSIYPELCSLYLKRPDEMSDYDKTVRAFSLIALEQWDVIKKLSAIEVYQLLPLIDWVFNKLDLVVNHMPDIEIGGLSYIGPTDEMENLRFAEWCLADTHYINFAKHSNYADLHYLAACLYRPAGEGAEYIPTSSTYRGDQREKFNDQLLVYRSGIMSTLPKATLDGIYLFFASSKHRITKMYPEFFPPAPKDKPVQANAGDQQFSWFDIYDDLRGDPKFGGPEKLEDEFLHTVLASIERSKKTMKDLKKRHKI